MQIRLKQSSKMFKLVGIVLVLSVLVHENLGALISRAAWGARAPNFVSRFNGIIPYVVIHHSYEPGVCYNTDACKAAMRSMQNFHMNTNGWPDIGYSFAVGGDGNIYEGRGWNVEGAHTPGYNSRSVGLLLIGDFRTALPPANMLTAAKNFIAQGVNEGRISGSYKLIGHRQAYATECPGERLYNEIRTWARWTANP
ncbi:peptidoglycan-recognition protein LB-like [Hermetia illucens]|nr:peptidoglycan-recognition protein LB-like [Hermetia illucens]